MLAEQHLVFATDGGYAPVLSVALVSLSKVLSPERRSVIHIVHDGLGLEDRRLLSESITASNAEMKFHDCGTATVLDDVRQEMGSGPQRISYVAYFRLLLPDLLPDVDRCLYLDCDLLFRKPLCGLYDVDFGARLLAAVPDYGIAAYTESCPSYAEYARRMQLPSWPEYFNTGVLLMNLRRMREVAFFDRCRSNLVSSVYGLQDQDVLNGAARGCCLHLDYSWNAQCVGAKHLPEADVAAVIHFNGLEKPWDDPSAECLEEWWGFARESPYYSRLCASAPWSKWVLASSWARGAYRCWLRVLALCSFGDRRRTYRRLYHGLGSLGRG